MCGFHYSFVNKIKTEVLNISMYVHCKILVIKYILKYFLPTVPIPIVAQNKIIHSSCCRLKALKCKLKKCIILEVMWSSSIGHGNQWEEFFCIGIERNRNNKKLSL
jgi:hypothetical protein